MAGLPSNFSLERFAEVYVSNAVEEARKELSPKEFNLHVWKKVAEEMGWGNNTKCVLYLHHSFHWAFFLEDGSIFRQVQSKNRHDKCYICLKEEVSQDKIKQFARDILARNRPYLEARVNNLCQAA